jgi:hypothetical protein
MAVAGRNAWLDFAVPAADVNGRGPGMANTAVVGFTCKTSGRGFEWDGGGGGGGGGGGYANGGGGGGGGRFAAGGGDWARALSSSWFACAAPAHPTAGYYALSVGPPLLGLDRWGAAEHASLQLLVREEPTVSSVLPSAVAAGAGHINRPLTVTGANLPCGGGGGGGDYDHGSAAWCVGLGGAGLGLGGYAAREPARAISSALVTCPPFSSAAAAAWAASGGDSGGGGSAGGSLAQVEVAWWGAAQVRESSLPIA